MEIVVSGGMQCFRVKHCSTVCTVYRSAIKVLLISAVYCREVLYYNTHASVNTSLLMFGA